MTFSRGAALIAAAWFCAGVPALAASKAAVEASVTLRERWMYLTRDVADPATWAEAQSKFLYRKTVPGGFNFVLYDPVSGAKTPAFDQAKLAAGLSKAMGQELTALRLPFDSFTYEKDGQAIAFTSGEGRWTCTLTAYECGKAPPRKTRPRGFGVVRDLSVPADNTPKRSPDGRFEAFVQGDNLAVRSLPDGVVKVLSTDGSPGDFYDPETIAWSPDSSKLAVYRVRPGYSREVLRVETSPGDQVQPKLQTQLYPKPGDAVDIERPVLFDVTAGKQIGVAEDLFPNPYSMSRLAWRKDSRTVSFEYDQRGHQALKLIEVDAATGAARAVIDERSKTFINMGRTFRQDIGADGREVVWMSERDGWNHLYLYDGRSGRVKTQITKGEWIVRKVLKVDEDKRRIWFAASGMRPGEDPYLQHVYRVDFDGRNLTPLTTADAWHDVAFSADMNFYLDTYSRTDQPNISELRRADGSLVARIETGDITELKAAGWKAPEVFKAKGRDGKTDIWGLVVRPKDYDPAKRYPVIENIYAGPHDSFVPKTFWPFGYHSGGDKVIGMQSQADLGFIVVQMDGMGTLNRSKAFHDVAWKNLGDSGFPDRILWHKALAARDPAYDISRVGIYGASAGGQSAFGALIFHPEFYKAAVAYAGCYDNRMDKISWNEQWMGWPVDGSYARASGVDNAHKLQGEVLLIVGEQDSNVDPASTLQVVNALIKADKDFELLMVPGEGHAVGRSTGPIPYVQRRQFDFFMRTLRGEGALGWNRSAAP
ncbi:DPP IV N-terminal domain-containing protein [Caulobacter segnis]|uniref:S9 family peptidase n=1 Tax=Caulobacter segnis TaxID=88688 RepID=UPI00240F89EC|nr:S9 family peptidase [Caulobacter segnis]MDG2521322.1 DPP IV N-terminal domain-containing protein [Caulobacter segnis]